MIQAEISPASLLAQRLLWNRAVGRSPRPLPIVILLGPVGAGKSHALGAVSSDSHAGVVHASFNFDRSRSADRGRDLPTWEVLANIADALSRRWKSRPKVRFTRFALGIIAVDTTLDGLSREQAKEKLRAEIARYANNPRGEAVTVEVFSALTDVAKQRDFIDETTAETIKKVLPRLARTITRKPLGKAKRWYSDIPQAEGSEPIDALISLNRLKSEHPRDMTDWLFAAFLADIRESYPKMASPDSRSPCACENPERLRHWHNWLLLLDNVDHGVGEQFIADLLSARKQHAVDHPSEHDPLLIMATSGRWNRQWEHEWRSPWLTASDTPDRRPTAPHCRKANYEGWSVDAERPRSSFYPVLIEPLRIDETARILSTSQYSPVCDLVQRATGGLPGAVELVASLVRDRTVPTGARDVLETSESAGFDVDLWYDRLKKFGLPQERSEARPTELDDLISAAPFATAPWLVPGDARSIVSFPQIGRILTELRASLWITPSIARDTTSDDTELHPWIGRILVSALAHRKPNERLPSYEDQFKALLRDDETKRDPARTAYCQLALGQLSEVVSFFEKSFDTESHRDWSARLRFVTRAPDNLSLQKSCTELYQELVNADAKAFPIRSPIRNVVARLVAASWLAANPFAVSDKMLQNEIANAYRALQPLSRRPDVGDLHE